MDSNTQTRITRSLEYSKDNENKRTRIMYIFHKIKAVAPLKDYVLLVTFVEGFSKTYDVKPLFKKWEVFNELKKNNLFKKARVEKFGDAVIWNSQIDLHCNELFEKGKLIATPFDGLISFVDATKLWGLNESTLRKAVQFELPPLKHCMF